MKTHRCFSVLCMIALISLMLGSCYDSITLVVAVPGCVESKIKAELKSGKPPIEVWECKVDQQTYYYFVSECCDHYNHLHDSNCDYVCASDGGPSGAGDGQCPGISGIDRKETCVEKVTTRIYDFEFRISGLI